MNILFLERKEHPFSDLARASLRDHTILKARNVDHATELIFSLGIHIAVVDCTLFSYSDIRTLRSSTDSNILHIVGVITALDLNVVQNAVQSGADSIIVDSGSPADFIQRLQQQLTFCTKLERTLRKKMKGFTTSVAHTLHHEFRTPLNAVLNFTDLLYNKQIAIEEQDMVFDSLHASARRLYATVEKFLLYAEVELLSTYTHDLSQELCENGDDIVFAAAVDEATRCRRNDDLVLDIRPMPCIAIKHYYFQFVICEIIHNAFKFSKTGDKVQIYGNTRGDQYELIISDGGCGMTAVQVANIAVFQQFERQKQEQQGVGMGLAIVKKIMSLFGATLQITSSVGNGTSVTMAFPCVASPSSDERQSVSLGFLTPFEFERQNEYEMEEIDCFAH